MRWFPHRRPSDRWRPVVVAALAAAALAGLGGSTGLAVGAITSTVAEHHDSRAPTGHESGEPGDDDGIVPPVLPPVPGR